MCASWITSWWETTSLRSRSEAGNQKEENCMHDLDFSKGFAAIAYRGRTPWHELGRAITQDLPLQEWQRLAGLDYEVQRRPVFTFSNAGAQIRLPKRRALVRSDTERPLSIVGDNYKIVQPNEV